MSSEIEKLYKAILTARAVEAQTDATARLLKSGRVKMGKKVIEEAAEVALEAIGGKRKAVVRETADLLYNLTALLASLDIPPEHIWKEMAERAARFGLAGKLPKKRSGAKAPVLPSPAGEGTGP